MAREYYGFIGNGCTAALVGPDLALAWLCVPRFDGAPLFAGALDPRKGGALTLVLEVDGAPVALQPVRQAYVGHSAVLQSAVVGDGWELQAEDFMPWGGGGVVRRLTVRSTGGAGQVGVRVGVTPVASAAWAVKPWAGRDKVRVEITGAASVLASEPALTPVMAAGGLGATVELGAVTQGGTATATLYLAYGGDATQADSALADLRGRTAEAELAFWQQYLAPARTLPGDVDPRWEAVYWRSLVVMKLLSYEPTGALLAAPTASLPAIPGGGDNWDYRYIWLRDGYYTAMTFDAAGLHAEAAAFYDFAFSLQGADGHWRQPLYTVDGGDPQEFIVDDLTGPGGETPVRFGNAASGQLQLDNEGNILHGLWFHYKTSGDTAALERHWDSVRRAAQWTMANWRTPESGIWEIREYVGHWVHGKVMCLAALTSAARIAAALGHEADAAQFRQVAATIQADVLQGGWYPERGAFLRHYGTDWPAPLDISVLALAFYGVLPPDHPQLMSTVHEMEQASEEGGLWLHGGVCRWERAAVPFYLPTLWLARYYLMNGRTADCDRLLNACLDSSTSLLLMAEHFDGRDASQWGNFPQAFSHEEVARLILERTQGFTYGEWERQA